jgi:16S rRNA U1498 N3-methylase RsmE
MEWIPVFFIVFKLTVLGTAAFFAINSHRAGAKREQEEERERQARNNASQALPPSPRA